VQALKQQEKPIKAEKTLPHQAWLVVIASFDRLQKAKEAQRQKRIASLQSSITTVHLKHGTWFRLVRAGFASKEEAKAFAKKIRTLGFKDAWIQHRP